MATKTPVTSYDVNENRIDVSPEFGRILTPTTALLNKIGISTQAIGSTTYEWYDEPQPILATSLTAAHTSGGGTLTVASTIGILPNSIIKVNDVIYRVTSINSNTELAVTVISGSDANHAENDEVTIVSSSAKEAEDYQDSSYSPSLTRENITQIFKEYVKISGTQSVVARKINGDLTAEEVEAKLKKLRIQLERALWMGIKVKPSDNNSPRLMGGIDWMIKNYNGIESTTTFSEDNFKAFLKLIYDKRGSTNEAWLNAKTLDNFMSLNSSSIRTDQSANQVGRNITTFVSQYGQTMLNVSPDIPANKIYVVDSGNIKVKPLNNRQFAYEPLAKLGDADRGQILGEYTMEFRNPELAGVMTLS
ncbi:MAG: SU10 major capsid protein [Thermotogota bacterium]